MNGTCGECGDDLQYGDGSFCSYCLWDSLLGASEADLRELLERGGEGFDDLADRGGRPLTVRSSKRD